MSTVPQSADAPAATPTPAADGSALLEVDHLVKHFPIKSGILIDREMGQVRAVDDVSLHGQARARRSAWSASPAAASRRCAARCCA